MGQRDLLFHPMARRADPDSSHEAADLLERTGRSNAQRKLAITLVARWPGKTSRELAEISGEDRYMLARRLPEAETEGQLFALGRKPNRGPLRWYARDID